MDQRACLALLVRGEPGLREAEALVRAELCRRGEEPWAAMELEFFPGGETGLLIARRRAERRIYISATALCVLMEH